MFFGQAAEVKVGKNVSQQDKPAKAILLQHAGGVFRTADFRPQVQIGEDERVVEGGTHHLLLVSEQC